MRIEAGDKPALERLLRYIVRCPFSIERVIRLSDNDHVIYRAEHDDPRRFPLPQGVASFQTREPARPDAAATVSASQPAAAEQALRGGPARNFQVFDALDFIAEVTQHIPNAGQHFIH